MQKDIRILYVEDDPMDVQLAEEILKGEGFLPHLMVSTNTSEFLLHIKEEDFDIILSDFSLPDFDGFSALDIAHRTRPDIPFIFLSGQLGEEAAIKALKNGAVDYVTKQNIQKLPSIIERALAEADEKKKLLDAQGGLTRLASVVQQASESITITDLEGNIEYVNKAFTEITGFKAGEVIGKNPSILNSGTQDKDFYANLWSNLLSGKTWHGTFVNRKKDGSLYHEKATIFPIRDKSGEVFSYAAVKNDISEEKKMQSLLQQSQKLEAIGQLAGGIAHDFNNVLSVINGFADLAILRIDASDKYYKAFSEISKAGKKAGNLIRRLMTFSRNQIIDPKYVSINRLIEDLKTMLVRLIGEDIDLKLKLSKKIGYIYMDSSQIEQILINLIVNARDALNDNSNKKGKKTIVIETGNTLIGSNSMSEFPDSAAGEYINVKIKDSGCGIDDLVKEHIFEPFYTTKPKGVGTGLGLSTVYGIVKQNKGGIKVTSKVGKGTCFTIYLPVSKVHDESSPDVHEEIHIEKGKGNILLVEDEEGVREFTMDALISFGYTVTQVSDGEAALKIIKSNGIKKYDLIVTDVVMPRLSGLELARELSNEANEKPKILFISGYVNRVELKNNIIDKKYNFLQKPFSVEDLSEKVKLIIESDPALN